MDGLRDRHRAPALPLLTKRRWHGQRAIPPTGGVIIAANHLSWVDPFTLGHFVYKAGRIPRFMAKESLFRLPVVGWICAGRDQIPVHRGERDGAAALSDAVEALRDGEAVLIYPEGTITKDPDWWPMQAKTGVARLALMSGAPIVPVAQWGPQEILGRSRRLHLFPRRTIAVHALEPLYPAAAETGAATDPRSAARADRRGHEPASAASWSRSAASRARKASGIRAGGTDRCRRPPPAPDEGAA